MWKTVQTRLYFIKQDIFHGNWEKFSPATSSKKKYPEDNILFDLYFTFGPKIFNKR